MTSKERIRLAIKIADIEKKIQTSNSKEEIGDYMKEIDELVSSSQDLTLEDLMAIDDLIQKNFLQKP